MEPYLDDRFRVLPETARNVGLVEPEAGWDRRSGEAGTDHGDPYSRASQLPIDRFAQTVDEGLTGGVRGAVGQRVERDCRRYLNDVAHISRRHPPESCVSQPEDDEGVQDRLLLKVVGGPRGERCDDVLPARVVH